MTEFDSPVINAIYINWENDFKDKVYNIINNDFTEDDLTELIEIARNKPIKLSHESLRHMRYNATRYCDICDKPMKYGTVWYHMNRSKEHKKNEGKQPK